MLIRHWLLRFRVYHPGEYGSPFLSGANKCSARYGDNSVLLKLLLYTINASIFKVLDVHVKCVFPKSGATCRGERLAKYNRLLRIEEELGRKAKYVGKYKVH